MAEHKHRNAIVLINWHKYTDLIHLNSDSLKIPQQQVDLILDTSRRAAIPTSEISLIWSISHFLISSIREEHSVSQVIYKALFYSSRCLFWTSFLWLNISLLLSISIFCLGQIKEP